MNSTESTKSSGKRRGRPPKKAPADGQSSRPYQMPRSLPLQNRPGEAVDLADMTLVGITRNKGLWSAVELRIDGDGAIGQATTTNPDTLQMAMSKAAQIIVGSYRRMVRK